MIIPVGEFYVSTDPQKELITVVGSCVAVKRRGVRRRVAPQYRQTGTALLISTDGQNDFSKIDPNVLDKNSGKIAKIILTKWNMPDKIIRAAIDFDNPPAGSSDHHKLIAIIHVARGLSHFLGISFGAKM